MVAECFGAERTPRRPQEQAVPQFRPQQDNAGDEPRHKDGEAIFQSGPDIKPHRAIAAVRMPHSEERSSRREQDRHFDPGPGHEGAATSDETGMNQEKLASAECW